ncbi:MAG: SAM-dependent methyltransferase [Acidobacteriota bacterium]|nr:SAM-dependent methyltransferase [Acidobacteriota bacterium]
MQHVSDTAFWVAHYRAIEGERPDALFHDPLAGVLAGERGRNIAEHMPMSFLFRWSVVLRTCIIDAYLREAIAAGADTVLNLGAGLDTRPYRLELPGPPSGILWIEADFPEMIDYKEQRLANERPRCRLERVKIDLADAAARRALLASVDARARSLIVLTEGVVPYLSEADVGSLADDLRALAHVRCWVLDYFSFEAARYRRRNRMTRRLSNAPMKFAPKDWWGFFEAHGWRRKEIRYYMEEAQRLKRPLDLPWWMSLIFRARGIFISKERREAFQKLAGYAVMEPMGP